MLVSKPKAPNLDHELLFIGNRITSPVDFGAWLHSAPGKAFRRKRNRRLRAAVGGTLPRKYARA